MLYAPMLIAILQDEFVALGAHKSTLKLIGYHD